MRIQFACLLLVLLSATVLSRDANIKTRYKKFIKQHINEQMSNSGCDQVIGERNIKDSKKKCKITNTFILANITTVKSVCKDKGEKYDNMTKSLQNFDIVVCKLQKRRAKNKKCHYRGSALNRKIIIKCERGFPVHYEKDIRHCENWLNIWCVLQLPVK